MKFMKRQAGLMLLLIVSLAGSLKRAGKVFIPYRR